MERLSMMVGSKYIKKVKAVTNMDIVGVSVGCERALERASAIVQGRGFTGERRNRTIGSWDIERVAHLRGCDCNLRPGEDDAWTERNGRREVLKVV